MPLQAPKKMTQAEMWDAITRGHLQMDALKIAAALKVTADDRPMMTADEVADLVRMSRRHFDNLRKAPPPGFPKEYRAAKRPLFKRADVLAWLEFDHRF
ncbi:hypothetical protein QH494_02670 [Sphingomonas sp. AR_OL41]|uniref:helix-turn-helix transcriptional regulator n=1 Tax=Sphingomonas sp. AR_OL41 TaxID=3042729 RepID=UPI002480D07B|nr:hypothetical protein [Sphingomonas sp. AR_OL41]MDH7971073.1 hypothetical protein [Sphingomonas sp. AR_OL41]